MLELKKVGDIKADKRQEVNEAETISLGEQVECQRAWLEYTAMMVDVELPEVDNE